MEALLRMRVQQRGARMGMRVGLVGREGVNGGPPAYARAAGSMHVCMWA